MTTAGKKEVAVRGHWPKVFFTQEALASSGSWAGAKALNRSEI